MRRPHENPLAANAARGFILYNKRIKTKNVIFSKICIDKMLRKYYNNHCRKTNASFIDADVAELADAQDLKSCGLITRAGSIPAICTNNKSVRTTDTKINQ